MFNLFKKKCEHWWSEPFDWEYDYHFGIIVCTEQKTNIQKVQIRTCKKCGIQDTLKIGEPVYVGWT